MLLVICGAGASLDSVDPSSWSTAMDVGISAKGVDNFQPPLANDVFDNRPNFKAVLSRFEECAGFVASLRRIRPDERFLLERELRKRQDEADGSGFNRYHQELVAIRFYLQHVLWECGTEWHAEAGGATNYAELLARLAYWNHLTHESVCFVTFNYDTLLEAAATRQLGIHFKLMTDYVADEAFKFVKPHGSSNWTRPVPVALNTPTYADEDEARRVLIRQAPNYNLGSYEVRTPDKSQQDREPGARAIHLPALAIPVERKVDYQCPGFHLKVMEEAIAAANRVLVIGWSATEFDFIGKLKMLPQRARWLLVNGNEELGKRAWKNLLAEGIRAPSPASKWFNGGFSDLLGSEEFEEFLADN